MSGPSTPLASVIVPAFNAERTLRRTLDSAARQSWTNIEIIIVDDGSTDDTAEIAAAFCSEEKRAKLLRQNNAGVAAARNKAISEASGQWIAPLDADDLWHAEKIERQLEAAGRISNAGLVYCWSRRIDADEHVIGNAAATEVEGYVLCEHLRSNFIGNGSTPLISKQVLRDLRYSSAFDGCADYLLQLQLAMKTRFAVAPAYLVGYRVTDTNMSSDALRMIREHVRMFELVLPMLKGDERRIATRQLSRWRTKLGLVLLRRGEAREAGFNLLDGFRAAPAALGLEVIDQLRLAARSAHRSQISPSGRTFAAFAPDELSC